MGTQMSWSEFDQHQMYLRASVRILEAFIRWLKLECVHTHVHVCNSLSMNTWVCAWASKCRRVILPVSYFWHGCVVSQAAAQLVNINAVWRSDGDWSWHVVTLWWKALWNDVAGVFLLSAERWQAGCGICVFVCASMPVREYVCARTCWFFSWCTSERVLDVQTRITAHTKWVALLWLWFWCSWGKAVSEQVFTN